LNTERIEKICNIFKANSLVVPAVYTDYKKLIAAPEVQAVLIPTSWNSHLAIAADVMKAGKYAAIEVGGAASLDELWQLVHNSENFGGKCMMLENCCYGRNELMVLNMVRQGLLGEIVHCSCGYEHDIAYELVDENGCTSERAMHNLKRNGDLYPTHGLGPISKILRINRGNRFLTITSTASKARGFSAAAAAHGIDAVYNQGDMVTSVIRCANGETIMLRHCISLPRPYSRDCRVQGTRGIWLEDVKGIYVENISKTEVLIDAAGNPYTTHHWSGVSDFYEKYDHPIWKEFSKNQIGEHGGMDYLVLSAFVEAVQKRQPTPIDVYDVAAWMSVTALSEQSVALGGQVLPFPDFTNGKWIAREPEMPSKWALNEIYENY
jgi:predicted dehydrogenase